MNLPQNKFTPAEMAALQAVPWKKLYTFIEESDMTADELLAVIVEEIAELDCNLSEPPTPAVDTTAAANEPVQL